MTRTSKAVAAPRNPARGGTSIQEFANNNLVPELSRQRAAVLLDSRELLQDIRGLTAEDQTRFLDKADQVCRDGSLSALKIFPQLFLKRHIQPLTRKMRDS